MIQPLEKFKDTKLKLKPILKSMLVQYVQILDQFLKSLGAKKYENMRTTHHETKNNSKCGICQTVFDKQVMLKNNFTVDHKLQYANHSCPLCRFGCYINTDLESHKVQKHHDLKQFLVKAIITLIDFEHLIVEFI